jgi:hypothetical protein
MNIMPPMSLARVLITKSLAGLLALALVAGFITCLTICGEDQQARDDDISIQLVDAISDSGCDEECQVESIPGVLPGKQTINSIPSTQANVLISSRLNTTYIGQLSKPTTPAHSTHDPPRERLCVFRI